MITSISSSTSTMGHMRMQRPDPSQMANRLFSRLDTKNQGYIEKSDLQSAFDSISGSESATSVDDIFQQLDGDSDGKVSFKEAMAYDQANSSGASSGTSAGTSASDSSEAAVMKKIMQLMHAYGGFGQDASQSGLASLLSVSA